MPVNVSVESTLERNATDQLCPCPMHFANALRFPAFHAQHENRRRILHAQVHSYFLETRIGPCRLRTPTSAIASLKTGKLRTGYAGSKARFPFHG